MLTRYTFCIPLKTRIESEVIQAYVNEVYAKFGGSVKILSENGTEFKNQLFTDMATQLGVEWNVKFIPLLTILRPLEELKVSIIFSSYVCLNMYQNLLNGPSSTIGLCCIYFFTK